MPNPVEDALVLEPMGKFAHNGLSDGNGSPHVSRFTGLLNGDSATGIHKQSLYEHNGVAVCSQRRALIVATAVFAILFAIAVIIAFAGPQTYCPCAGKRPDDLDYDDDSTPVIPVATNNEIFPWNNVRLPDFVQPMRYRIHIHPNLTTLVVKGQVAIDFTVTKETYFVVLHSKNLTIFEKSVVNDAGQELEVERFLEYPRAQQIYLELKDPLPVGANFSINIRYSSRLGRELEGFYLSSYINKKGDTKYLATTHFEPTYARYAFPCFDEPGFKAKFKMSIVRDRFHIALFNMPILSTEDAGFYMGTGLLRDEFEESVEMSTYLVAFVVCDYTHITQHTKQGISVSVYSPKELISQADFALKTASAMMDHYADFFGVPYALPKQDLIVIPDFAAGAMENWGLITYRETSILYDAVETSATAHQWVAIVVAHELAHQWFGNLVTMKWWNDLWLNEGFASFLEYTGVDHVMPDWKMMEQFILDKTQPALNLDALATSHPISVDVHDPMEIEAIFDTISYSKGAAILYMLEKFLEKDALRSGLNDYLNTHMYGNADTEDLWEAFSKHNNQSLEVKKVMDSWTQQMGFPLVTIEKIGTTTIRASQSRFLLTAALNQSVPDTQSPFQYKWYVPLNYYTDRNPADVSHVWMNLTDVEFEVPPSVQWIKANVNQSGFYRVTYGEEIWMSIINTLIQNHTVFSPADRASLIDDAFTLCRAGIVNATIPLELSLYLLKERDYVPWATALEHLQGWSKNLAESSAYKLFFDYMRQILTPVARDIGWEDSGPHLYKLMRSDILSSAILCNIPDTVKEARSRFRSWMEKGTRVPPNLREVVYSAGIKYGGEKEWVFCWGKYNSTGVPSERKLLLRALGVANDPWILQKYLRATLDRTLVKPQDLKIALGVVASNPEGQLLAWRHLKAHWQYMQSMFGNGTFTLGSIISAVTSHFATEYDHLEVDQFFNKQNVGSGQRALEQSLETIRLNIHWVRENDLVIHDWLRTYLKA